MAGSLQTTKEHNVAVFAEKVRSNFGEPGLEPHEIDDLRNQLLKLKSKVPIKSDPITIRGHQELPHLKNLHKNLDEFFQFLDSVLLINLDERKKALSKEEYESLHSLDKEIINVADLMMDRLLKVSVSLKEMKKN